MPLTPHARWRSYVIASALAVTWGPFAHAEGTTSQCIASYESGQALRNARRLLEAKKAFIECSAEACPQLARQDCVGWLREVDAAIPSIVIGVRTTAGLDVMDAETFLDGTPLDQTRTAEAIELDPGEHRIRVRRAGGSDIAFAIVVAPGERNRLVRVMVPEKPAPALARTTTPTTSNAPWFLAGGSALAIGAGIALDVIGSSTVRRLRDECAPTCSDSQVDGARAMIITGDVLLVTGVIAGAAALWLALTRANHASSGSSSSSSGSVPPSHF